MKNYPDFELANDEKVQVEDTKKQSERYAPFDPFNLNNAFAMPESTTKSRKKEKKLSPPLETIAQVDLAEEITSTNSKETSYIAEEEIEDTPFLIEEESFAEEEEEEVEEEIYKHDQEFEYELKSNSSISSESAIDVLEAAQDRYQLAETKIQELNIPVYSEQITLQPEKKILGNAKKSEKIRLENMVRTIRDHQVITICSSLGASGCSTLTLALARVYSEIRNEQSAAVDLVNEGNLGLLSGNNGNINSRWYKDIFDLSGLKKWEFKHDVQKVLYYNPELAYGNVAVSPSHDFRVASHFGNKLRSEPLTALEYEKINSMLKHFDAVFNDVGKDVTTPALIGTDENDNKIGTLADTTNLILVVKPSYASVESGLRKLATIRTHDFSSLVRRSCVVINCTKKEDENQIESTRAAFQSFVRAIEVFPYDKEIKNRSVVDVSKINHRTYSALLRILARLSY